MSVYDRWWKTQRQADGSVRRVPSADYGCAKRWQVRWRDESGRQRKRNFSKRDGKNPEKDALAFDAKMKAALDAAQLSTWPPERCLYVSTPRSTAGTCCAGTRRLNAWNGVPVAC
jgi:hypothetical protein